MKKIVTFGLILILAISLAAIAGAGMNYELGKKVTELELRDLDGNKFSLGETLGQEGVKGVVFMFVSRQCPVSKACDKRYVEMAARFKEDGILFVGINSNYTESIEQMKAHAKAKNYNFPVLKDWDNVIADRFGALYTPHTYFVDKEGTLLYRGRIDDNHRRARLVKETTLVNAVNEYLAGQELTIKETLSSGCSIKRVKPEK